MTSLNFGSTIAVTVPLVVCKI